MEPDANGYASPRGWHNLFPEGSYDVVAAMSTFWFERGWLCGQIAAGDPAGTALDELRKFDAAAAELVASTVLSLRES